MEPRKITIVQTKNQKRSVIESSAMTLGELKDDLRTNGIDYEGMAFYEGLTKTELKSNESILPHDIERNGIITNELVFMLTNTEKKIKSGTMSRVEAYVAIKAKNLQSKCIEMFGKNFTMCKTSDLIYLIEKNADTPTLKEKTPSHRKENSTSAVKAPDHLNNESHNYDSCIDSQARASIRKLVEVLSDSEQIEDYEATEILDILGGEVEMPSSTYPTKKEVPTTDLESPYTQDEINQMFRGIR